MLTIEKFIKEAGLERFENLTQTSGESVDDLATRIVNKAKLAIESCCIRYNGSYTDTPIIEDAVYTYAVGLLYSANQLDMGKDEMVRAEKIIENLFFSSPLNPNAKSKPGVISGFRIDVCEDE